MILILVIKVAGYIKQVLNSSSKIVTRKYIGIPGGIQIDPSTGQSSSARARASPSFRFPWSAPSSSVAATRLSVLNVTQEELARLKAGGLIEIGGAVYTGGITLKGPVTIALAVASVHRLRRDTLPNVQGVKPFF